MPINPFQSAAERAPLGVGIMLKILREEAERRAREEAAGKNSGVLVDVPAHVPEVVDAVKSAVPMNAPLTPANALAQIFGGQATQRALGLDRGAPQALENAAAPTAVANAFSRTPYARPNFGAGEASAPDPVDEMFGRIVGLEGGTDRQGNFLTSPKGALGPAQVMPGTAPEAARLAGLPWDENRYRTDANYNLALGKAYFRQQLQTFKDPDLAAAAYNAGPRRVQRALAEGGPQGWVAKLPAETQLYVQNFRGKSNAAAGQVPQFQNPFGASLPYRQAQMEQIDAAQQAAMTPFSADIPTPPPPAYPDMPEMPKRDYSKTDQMLEALRPVEMMDADRRRIKRANLFQGLAKGLASIPAGAGLGQVLGQLGAGMLAGRGMGDAELQARADDFDKRMAAFNLAAFKYQDAKDTDQHAEAVDALKALYNHSLGKWQAATQQYNRDYETSVQGSNVVVRSRTNNGMHIQTIPIAPIVGAQAAQARANIFGDTAQAAQAGAGMEASATNGILASVFADNYQRARAEEGASGPGGIASIIASNSFLAGQLVDGGFARGLMGDELYDKGIKAINDNLTNEGYQFGSKEFLEEQKNRVTANIVSRMTNDAAFRARIQQQMPTLWEQFKTRRMEENYRTQTSTDSRGRTSTREGY